TPQPLPGPYQGRDFKIVGATDAGTVVRGNQAPLGLVFHPAVAGRLAFLTALPAASMAPVLDAFNVGVIEQNAEAVLVAVARRRQVNVEERALAMLVQAHAGFHRHGQARHDVLPE